MQELAGNTKVSVGDRRSDRRSEPATLVIQASEDGNVQMLTRNDVAAYEVIQDALVSVCPDAWTMTGTGRVRSVNEVVFPAPVLT